MANVRIDLKLCRHVTNKMDLGTSTQLSQCMMKMMQYPPFHHLLILNVGYISQGPTTTNPQRYQL